MSKVVIELRFKKAVPRSFLEELVMKASEEKNHPLDYEDMLKHGLTDKDVQYKVWFEICRKLGDDNPFMSIFKKRGG
jgi:hypothetical protein